MNPNPTDPALSTVSWRRWLFFTFLACLALSAYKAGRASTINNDGLLYLSTAQLFVEQGLKAAFTQFNWPAFSILIGLVHQVLSVSYESAAYILNALLLALLSVGFVALYREMTDGNGRPWLAAAVILLSPQLTDYRAYIIRDIGYWALSLWAVLHFVRYCRQGTWFDALAWQGCIVGAIAFRIEGAALAALLPLWCLRGDPVGRSSPRIAPSVASPHNTARSLLRPTALFLLGAAIVAPLLATGAMPLPSGSRLEQLRYFPILNSAGFATKAEAVARHAQAFYAPQDAQILLFGGVLYLFLYKTASCLGLVYATLLAWALWQGRAKLFEQPVIWCAAGITAIPLLAFAFNNLFLSARYMGLLTLLLSLPVVRAAETLLFEDGTMLRRRAAVLTLAAVVMLLDALIQTGPSKRYLREGGDWTRDHLLSSAALCSEDPTLLYYAGRGYSASRCPALEQLSQLEEGGHSGAFLIKVGRKEQGKHAQLQAILDIRSDWAISAQFGNESGDRLYIITPVQQRP